MTGSKHPISWREFDPEYPESIENLAAAERGDQKNLVIESGQQEAPSRKVEDVEDRTMQVKLIPARTQERDTVSVYRLVDFQDDINNALRDLTRNGHTPVEVSFGECECQNQSYTYLRKFAAISYLEAEPS